MKREIRCKVCRRKARRWCSVVLFNEPVKRREKWCGQCVDAYAVVRKAAIRRDVVQLGAFRQLLGRMFPRIGFLRRQAKRKQVTA